jgi:Mrp family chromosome partitioning ATPase
MTLAKNKSDKVCLIDADFSEHSLTEWLGLGQTTGLIDVLTLQHQDLAPQLHDQEALRLTVLGVGTLKQRSELGYYAEHAKALISTLQQQFTYIVIDAGEVFKSNELTIFGALADEVFAIVSSGQSRKGKLKAAITQMEKSAVPVAGVILNKATNVLPKFIYNSL